MVKVTDKITFYEYERKPFEEKGNYCFSEQELNMIEWENLKHHCKMFEVARNDIRATQYVGFIRIGSKTIQVMPKILKDDIDANMHFLLYLLKYTKKIDLKGFSQVHLDKYCGDFFEILIGIFAQNVNELLRRDLKRNYVVYEQNCRFLRGKLLVSKQVCHSKGDVSRLFCQYDNFTENNLINKTLKYVCALMLKISTNQKNCKLLEHNLILLADVQDQSIRNADIETIHFSRLNYEYKPLINLCRLFLTNKSINLQCSNFETFSFMFNMERLFEEFILQFLFYHKKELELISVKGQQSLGKLFHEFDMIYDILIETKEGIEFLIDTKYKTPDIGKSHEGLAQSDFYQMFAYAFSQNKKYQKVIMLYPKSRIHQTVYSHDNANHIAQLAIRCVDLEKIWDNENKKLDEGALISDLKRCLLF
jgi:5-methylcytosine-specific restriction enzyme subunit McrC